MKILVVEDEEDILNLVKLILEIEGHEVKAVSSGQLAIEELENGIPDLIILDIMMPEMNGWEFLEVSRGKYGKIPVIVFTANAQCNNIKIAQEKNVDYLIKPFDKQALVEKVNEYDNSW
ncbi:response regulator [Methanococcus voltae]|uniref:CheY-like chemotaxis protein n=2 Tax=Methanococcus voltae TaxID=2188 RepID=A0A8J7RF73_METVO|nr:response regulator transcription factor [Methanococcus voltae]MBP2171881.1 CheY-like chemotaxis protein [Methanococcus voltae]MBP2201164.1 CheY-like chemotaxis protein [Methanococcus voltae]MCS3921887.1 CheY-like chemotaxis protein [Methanococcus voltae PS]